MTQPFDPLIDQLPARYVVGIDLGTTNSAVAYVDTQESPWQVRVLMIPQLVASERGGRAGHVALVSLRGGGGRSGAAGALRLPWDRDDPRVAVGFYARDQGGRNPGRLITSAKSWLCHSGVDRTADLLPWHGAADVERLSPIAVSARILQHVRDGLERSVSSRAPGGTGHCAHAAGFLRRDRPRADGGSGRAGRVAARGAARGTPGRVLRLGVQPQRRTGTTLVQPGQSILVCDIGGGTSDFTLIRVRSSRVDATPACGRRAVAGATCPVSPRRRRKSLDPGRRQSRSGLGAASRTQAHRTGTSCPPRNGMCWCASVSASRKSCSATALRRT